jgi:hypothetical protein
VDDDGICPCNCRDADVNEFGACYGALYVSEDWVAGRVPQRSLPERRPERFVEHGDAAEARESVGSTVPGRLKLSYPVW